MHIVLVANTSWNIYNFRAGLVNYLLQKGHIVSVIAPRDSYTEKIMTWKINFFEITLESKGKNPISDISFYRQIRRYYKKIAPDVVLHFTIKPNIYGTLACRRLQIPCINNVSGLGTTFIHQKRLSSRIAHFLYRLAFRYAYKVFFQNKEDLALFLEKKLVSKEKTGLLAGSGINLERFKPLPKSGSQAHFTFLMIARLIYDKGIREYVTAARIVKKQFPHTSFRLIGGFEQNPKNSLHISPEEASTWQDTIEYLGVQEDVRPFIAASDVVVLPSYREGTPRSLLEAAAMGKPLLATNVAGCREVVEHQKNGLLCEKQNAQSLADAMIRLLQMPIATLNEMGAYSREKVEREFDEKFVFEAYWAVMEELQQAKKHTQPDKYPQN